MTEKMGDAAVASGVTIGGAKSYRLPECDWSADRGVDGRDYRLSLSLSLPFSRMCAIEIDFKRRRHRHHDRQLDRRRQRRTPQGDRTAHNTYSFRELKQQPVRL